MRNLFLSLSLFLTLLSGSRISHVTALGDVKTSFTEKAHRGEIAPLRAHLAVDFRTATGKTIRFKAPAQESVGNAESSDQGIPHLVLKRNGVPTPGFERTLIISLRDLAIPESGIYIRLVIETQHIDPDLDRKESSRIQVWKETRFISYDPRTEQRDKVQFHITFKPVTNLSHKAVKTPTDYYRCQIVASDSQGNQLQTYTKEYAFLLENQWRVPLSNLLEATPGAAPNELLVYYYDMVPFQAYSRNPETQIPKQEVDHFIQSELIPRMVKAIEVQSNVWALPWYKEWSNYRVEEDPKTLSVALGSYGTWFHGSAPSLGHAMISIRVDGGFREYATLTDGIMSVFHHELFHNQQRNISQHFGSKGIIAGKENAWELFSEGTAVLASAVGQPTVEFEEITRPRSYLTRANAFIGFEGVSGGRLNKRYKDNPYHIALYWRFLYENCGGINPSGEEDPSVGMRVIRNVLETLYKGEIVQISSSPYVTNAFPPIIDHALQSTPSCIFHSYEESLIHFAQAIYMLRLEDGRCVRVAHLSPCGFFDPHRLYEMPPAEHYLIEAGRLLEISNTIPSSYGIDLIVLDFNPSIQGKSLKLVFTSPTDSHLKFHLEVWKTKADNESNGLEGRSAQRGEPISITTENGRFVAEIKDIDSSEFDRLGLIITRMDPDEDTESIGPYSIQLIAE